MSVCVVCNKPSAVRCGRCCKAHYCGKDCQIQHWPIHRPECYKICNIEELIPKIWDTFITCPSHPRPFRAFLGTKLIKNRKCWFFVEEPSFKIEGNRKDYWTSIRCLNSEGAVRMSEEEFWVYETINSCVHFTVSLAVVLRKLLSGPKRLACAGELVTDIQAIRCTPNIDYTPHALCGGKQPLPKGKQRGKWRCEDMEPEQHLILALYTASGKIFGVDFTAAQFGVLTKTSGRYVHIKRLDSIEGVPMEDPLEAMAKEVFGDQLNVVSIFGSNSYALLLGASDPMKLFSEPLVAATLTPLKNALEKNLL